MNSPLGENRSGTPEGVRVPLDARRTLQVRWLVKLRLSAFCFLSFFLSFFSSVPRPTVMDPALHCRIDLTKVGKAARFLEWLAHSSDANKKTRRENGILFSSPAEAGEGDRPEFAQRTQGGGGGV